MTISSETKHFSIDARALLTLGRESIKDHTTAIVELVKNSYDADATKVEIEIFGNDILKTNYIRISDNGSGMTEAEVDSNWLRIGYSSKRSKKLSDSNRRRTGEKGIGRLSADRLGAILELKTKTSSSRPFGLSINWNDFVVEGKDLTSIPIRVVTGSRPQFPPIENNTNQQASHGTELIIRNLRQHWNEEDIKDLYDELAVLTPPFSSKKIEFEITLLTDLSETHSGIVKSSFVTAAELELNATISPKGTITYSIVDRQGRKKKRAPKSQTLSWNQAMQRVSGGKQKNLPPVVGAYSVQLLFYPRRSDLLEGTNLSLSDLREFLDANSGIKIYRDKIRVKPYGDPIDPEGDWLGLAERKTRSPAGPARDDFRFSSNQIVGAVFVSRDKNSSLSDSSSREGFIQGDAFSDLRSGVLACIFILENEYHRLFKEKKETEKPKLIRAKTDVKVLDESLKVLALGLEKLKENISPGASKVVNQSIDQIDLVIDSLGSASKSIDELATQPTIFRALATLGISAAVFGHETQTSIAGVTSSIYTAERLLVRSSPQIQNALREITKAKEYSEKVASWGRFALLRVKRDKRRKQRISIAELVQAVIEEIRPVLEASSINLQVEIKDIHARTFGMDIESVLINLITNAYTASQLSNRKRQIKITLESKTSDSIAGFSLDVADSGPGVAKRYIDQIWEPLFSTKVDRHGRQIGTGLGLTIVKSAVEDLDGRVSLDRDPQLEGARFSVWIPSS
ncbi:MAG TPA: sensor histidine kinase [Burkholderiales bacterium]|nr:sensor histidine kinase [Burkholderiales bacterium]